MSRNSAAAAMQRKGYTIRPVPRLQDVDPSALLSSLLRRRGVELSEATLTSVLSKRYGDGVCTLCCTPVGPLWAVHLSCRLRAHGLAVTSCPECCVCVAQWRYAGGMLLCLQRQQFAGLLDGGGRGGAQPRRRRGYR